MIKKNVNKKNSSEQFKMGIEPFIFRNIKFNYKNWKKQPLEITPQQYRLLCTIHKMKNKKPIELSRYLNVNRSTITRLSHKLEKKKLIKRVQNKDDERSHILQLTYWGKEIAKDVHKTSLSIIEEYITCMSYEEKENLIQKIKESQKNKNSEIS